MGKIIRGFIVLAIWGVLVVGICAALPDEVWQTFPVKLIPIRTFLAENKIISSEYASPIYTGSNRQQTPFPEMFSNGIGGEKELANNIVRTQNGSVGEFTRSSVPSAETTGPKEMSGKLLSEPFSQGSNGLSDQQTKEPLSSIPELDLPEMKSLPSISESGQNDTLPNLQFDSIPDHEKNAPTAGQELSSPNSRLRSGDSGLPAPEVAGLTIPPAVSDHPNQNSLAGNISRSNDPSSTNTTASNLQNRNSFIPVTPTTTEPLTAGTGANPNNSGSLNNQPVQSLAVHQPDQSLTENQISQNIGNSRSDNSNANAPMSENSRPNNHLIAAGIPLNGPSNNSAVPQPIGVTVPDRNEIAPASGMMPAGAAPPNGNGPLTNPLYIEKNRKDKIQKDLAAETPISPSDQLKALLLESQTFNDASSEEQIKQVFMKMSHLLTAKEQQLQPQEIQALQKKLDKLAFQIFYKPDRHILEPVYITVSGETLANISEKFLITPDFLAVLNGININPTQPLAPGTRLKVVHGPVSAVASINKKELLLLFNGFYAGRFRMGCSISAKTVRGTLLITNKVKNPDYKGPTEENLIIQDIPGGAPNNPLGAGWIELSNGLGLQGTNRPEYIGNETARNGGLIFSNQDISHLNILLTKGAAISVKD